MAISVTSAPVDNPAGLRITTGHFDFNGVTYGAGGAAVTAAQFGAGSNGIPSRLPDFVVFSPGTSQADDDDDFVTVLQYLKATSKVQHFAATAITDGEGLSETGAEAVNTSAEYLAIWVTPTVPAVTA